MARAVRDRGARRAYGRRGRDDLCGVRRPVVAARAAVLGDDEAGRRQRGTVGTGGRHAHHVRVSDDVFDGRAGDGGRRIARRVQDVGRLAELDESRVETVNRLVRVGGRVAGSGLNDGREAGQDRLPGGRINAHVNVRVGVSGERGGDGGAGGGGAGGG